MLGIQIFEYHCGTTIIDLAYPHRTKIGHFAPLCSGKEKKRKQRNTQNCSPMLPYLPILAITNMWLHAQRACCIFSEWIIPSSIPYYWASLYTRVSLSLLCVYSSQNHLIEIQNGGHAPSVVLPQRLLKNLEQCDFWAKKKSTPWKIN